MRQLSHYVPHLQSNLSKALLLDLCDNYQKHAQINTVFVQQEEMDRVGVEPTTSASYLKWQIYPLSKEWHLLKENCIVQIPPTSLCSRSYPVW